MRKLSILSYIFAGLMLSSCDGYLKEDPRDQLYPEDAYDTPQNVYLNTVASLYNYIGGYSDSQGLQGTYRGVYDLNTFTTDEPLSPPVEVTGMTVVSGKVSSCISGERIVTLSKLLGNICIK